MVKQADKIMDKIIFTVYDASLFLKMSKLKDEVWILKKNCVAVIDWGQPIRPADYSVLKTPQDSIIYKSYENAPYQNIPPI